MAIEFEPKEFPSKKVNLKGGSLLQNILFEKRDIEKFIWGSAMAFGNSVYADYKYLDENHFSDIRVKEFWGKFIDYEGDSMKAALELNLLNEGLSAMEKTPSTAKYSYYFDKLFEFEKLANIALAENKLIQALMETNLNDAMGAVNEIAKSAQGEILHKRAKNAVDIGLEFAEKFSKNVESIQSGLSNLDRAVGYFLRKELSILAARTSVGKTALAWQIARNVASGGFRTLYVSTELDAYFLWTRAACGALRIDMRRFRMNELSNEEKEAIEDMSVKLMNRYMDNLWVDDKSRSIEQIHESILSVEPDWVFLDHLNELPLPRRYESKRDFFGEAAYELRELAKKYNIHMTIVHQLSREVEARQEHEPQLADLRWSGDLEEKADIVLMLHRRDKYDIDLRKNSIVDMEAWIRKNRQGSADVKVNLEYDLLAQWCNPLGAR